MIRNSDIDGYSRFSILVHWITAVLIVLLFVTHEGDQGDLAYYIHVSFGAIAGLFLIWRVSYRFRKGMSKKPDQSPVLNLLSAIVIYGFLVCILVVILTGYLLPWSMGQPIDFMGLFAIPSPISRSEGLYEFTEELHEISGQAFIPLLILHVLGVAKHVFIDRDGIATRMTRASKSGI